MIVYFYLYYTHITLHLHLKCFRRLRLPLLSWKRHVVVSMPSFRDHKPRRGAPASAEGFLLLMFFLILFGVKILFVPFWSWWFWKDLMVKIGVLSTHEGSWRLAWNVLLPWQHNAQKAWTVTRAVTNSLVSSH